MTTELASWLLEQIAEDEDRPAMMAWLAQLMYEAWQPNNPYPFAEQQPDVRAEYIHAAGHVIDQTWSRVQADCEAKRRIVALHNQRGDGRGCFDCDTIGQPCHLHAALALAFTDRAGYLEEWRP